MLRVHSQDKTIRGSQPLSPSAQTNLLQWIKSYKYPHCRKVSNLSSLRTGIAIAQILSQKIPEQFHYLFLSEIQIYSISSETCIKNLSVILHVINMCYGRNNLKMKNMLQNLTAEGLYFEQRLMQKFIRLVLMGLDQYEFDASELVEISQNSKHKEKQIMKECNINGVEEMSDIANLSSIMPIQTKTFHSQYKSKTQESKQKQASVIETVSSSRMKAPLDKKDDKQYVIKSSVLLKVKLWMKQHHHLNADELSPQKLIGQLVNSIFSGSRLDQDKQIIKNSHYSSGDIQVYRKICDYLMLCQRLPKQHLIQMTRDIQLGVLRQDIYWGVITDLWTMRKNKMWSNRQRKDSCERLKTMESQKYNMNVVVNQVQLIKDSQKPKTIVKRNKRNIKIDSPLYDFALIKKMQNWIQSQLGYEHSLKKSRQQPTLNMNPLLNGVLIGSIIMRLQIGKVTIIKQPINIQQVDRNIAQVSNAIIKRGYQCGRKFAMYHSTYNTYIGIISQIKQQHHNKNQVLKQYQIAGVKQKQLLINKINETQKHELKNWLRQVKQIDLPTFPFLPASKLTELCLQTLQISLYRQTTDRIHQSNITKISQELIRLGFQVGSRQQLLGQEDQYRWGVVKSIKQLLNFKVFYY